VGLKSLKSLNLTNGYPNKNKKNNNNNNKVKSKPLELFELAGKKQKLYPSTSQVKKRLPIVLKTPCSSICKRVNVHLK
jgi:hypothetical protein